MVIRRNPSFYKPRFEWTDRGLLLITKRWILVTGKFAYTWR